MENIPTWVLVVAAALTDNSGRWLMHQRPPNKPHGGLWEFPGGKVEGAETPVSALVREIREELSIGLDARLLTPAGFAQSSGEGPLPSIVILLYITDHWQGEIESLEGGAAEWFTPQQIAQLPKPPLDVVLTGQLFGKMDDKGLPS